MAVTTPSAARGAQQLERRQYGWQPAVLSLIIGLREQGQESSLGFGEDLLSLLDQVRRLCGRRRHGSQIVHDGFVVFLQRSTSRFVRR